MVSKSGRGAERTSEQLPNAVLPLSQPATAELGEEEQNHGERASCLVFATQHLEGGKGSGEGGAQHLIVRVGVPRPAGANPEDWPTRHRAESCKEPWNLPSTCLNIFPNELPHL